MENHDLTANCNTVAGLAKMGFVYQGFDGNFHGFIRRHFYKLATAKYRTSFEEFAAVSTNGILLVGYGNSNHKCGERTFCEFSHKAVKCGVGFRLFEQTVAELKKASISPSNYIHAIGIQAKKEHIRATYERLLEFFTLADPDDFCFDKNLAKDI